MSDSISRQDAVNTIKRYKHRLEGKGQTYGFLLEEFEHQIPSTTVDVAHDIPEYCSWSQTYTNMVQGAMSSAEAVQRWIPVSERLPKEKQEVYVTVYFTEGDTGRAYGYVDGFGRWHLYSTVEGTLNSGYDVTAWMPLPEPYKGGDSE